MISEQRLEGEERVGMLSSGDSGTRHCIASAEALRQEHGWHVSRAAPGPLWWSGVRKGEGSGEVENRELVGSHIRCDLVRH